MLLFVVALTREIEFTVSETAAYLTHPEPFRCLRKEGDPLT